MIPESPLLLPPPLFPPLLPEGEGCACADELAGEGLGLSLEDEAGEGEGEGEGEATGAGATFLGAATGVDAGSAAEEDSSSSQSSSPEGTTVEVGSAWAAEADALADGVQKGWRLSFKFSV